MPENYEIPSPPPPPEPEWILDKNCNGHLYWRRHINDCDSENQQNNSRVKFKFDVEIKEFQRKPHELLEPLWTQDIQSYNVFKMSFTCLACLTVTFILPWYLLGGTSFY